MFFRKKFFFYFFIHIKPTCISTNLSSAFKNRFLKIFLIFFVWSLLFLIDSQTLISPLLSSHIVAYISHNILSTNKAAYFILYMGLAYGYTNHASKAFIYIINKSCFNS